MFCVTDYGDKEDPLHRVTVRHKGWRVIAIVSIVVLHCRHAVTSLLRREPLASVRESMSSDDLLHCNWLFILLGTTILFLVFSWIAVVTKITRMKSLWHQNFPLFSRFQSLISIPSIPLTQESLKSPVFSLNRLPSGSAWGSYQREAAFLEAHQTGYEPWQRQDWLMKLCKHLRPQKLQQIHMILIRVQRNQYI